MILDSHHITQTSSDPINPDVLTYNDVTRTFTTQDGLVYADVSLAGYIGGIPNTFGTRVTVSSFTQTAIQTAINTAATAGGGEVYLPNGTYNITGSGLVIGSDNIVITGESRTGVILNLTSTIADETGVIMARGTDNGTRTNCTATTFNGDNKITVGSAAIASSGGDYATDKYILSYLKVPAEFDNIYRLWAQGDPHRDYHIDMHKITGTSGNDIIISDRLIVDMDHTDSARIQPVFPIKNIGVQNLTINFPTGIGTPYAFGIYFYRCYNAFIRNVTINDPFCYGLYFFQSKHCEARSMYVSPAQNIDLGGYGYAGLISSMSSWIDNCTWDKPRHGPIFQGYTGVNAISNSTFLRTDAHVPHTDFSKRTIVSNCTVTKIDDYQNYYITMGALPDNSVHKPSGDYNAVYNCDFPQPPGIYSERGIQVGSGNKNYVFAHNRLVSGLYHNASRNPMIMIADNVWNVRFHNNVFWFDASKAGPHASKACFVDFLPGIRQNWTDPSTGTFYSMIQTLRRTYPSLENTPDWNAEAPGTDNTSTVHFTDNKVYGIPASKMYLGYNNKQPTTVTNTTIVEVQTTIPDRPVPPDGIVDMVSAQKQFRLENPTLFS